MRIPEVVIDAIRAMVNNDNLQFVNVEFHNDNLVLINAKHENEKSPRHYEFRINKDMRVNGIDLEIILPNRNDKLWSDNGYPVQGSTAFYKLDSIMSMFDLNDLQIMSVEGDMRLLNRMHCAFSHNMLSVEVATKPSIETTIHIAFIGRMNYDEQYKQL